MARMSRREAVVLFGLVVPISAALVSLVIGPQYLQPLPTWAKLIVAAACCCIIGAAAIYSRKRARSA